MKISLDLRDGRHVETVDRLPAAIVGSLVQDALNRHHRPQYSFNATDGTYVTITGAQVARIVIEP